MFVRTGATNNGSWLIFGRESSREPATRTNGQTTTEASENCSRKLSENSGEHFEESGGVFYSPVAEKNAYFRLQNSVTGAQKVISHKRWSRILSVCFESRWLRLRNVSTARIYQIVIGGHLRVQVAVGIYRLQSFVLIFPWVATSSSTVRSGFTALGQDTQHHRCHRVLFDAM